MLKCYVLTYEMVQGSCAFRNKIVTWARDVHEAIRKTAAYTSGVLVEVYIK